MNEPEGTGPTAAALADLAASPDEAPEQVEATEDFTNSEAEVGRGLP